MTCLLVAYAADPNLPLPPWWGHALPPYSRHFALLLRFGGDSCLLLPLPHRRQWPHTACPTTSFYLQASPDACPWFPGSGRDFGPPPGLFTCSVGHLVLCCVGPARFPVVWDVALACTPLPPGGQASDLPPSYSAPSCLGLFLGWMLTPSPGPDPHSPGINFARLQGSAPYPTVPHTGLSFGRDRLHPHCIFLVHIPIGVHERH